MRSLLPYVDMIKISDEETELLTDYQDPEQAARKLYRQGIKIVRSRLAAKGLTFIVKKENVRYPALKAVLWTQWRRRFFLGRLPVQDQ